MTNIPNGPVLSFVTKVQQANNRKSPNVQLTMAEAINLSAELTSILLKQQKLLEDIIELQKRALQPQQIEMNGGEF